MNRTRLDILDLYMEVEDDYSFDIRCSLNAEFFVAAELDAIKVNELLQPLRKYIEDNV